MKIHFKQDSSNSFIFKFLFPFYPMLSSKIIQIEFRILYFYSNLAHKKAFFLTASLNDTAQHCFKMPHLRTYV